MSNLLFYYYYTFTTTHSHTHIYVALIIIILLIFINKCKRLDRKKKKIIYDERRFNWTLFNNNKKKLQQS